MALSYHGKTVEQCEWVLEYFGTPEKQELYKDNLSYQEWLQECRDVIAARRLDF